MTQRAKQERHITQGCPDMARLARLARAPSSITASSCNV